MRPADSLSLSVPSRVVISISETGFATRQVISQRHQQRWGGGMRSCVSALLVCAHPDSEDACPSHAPFRGLRALPVWGSVDSHRPIPSACLATRDPVRTPPLSPRLRSASQGAHAARSPGLPRHRDTEETESRAHPGGAPRAPRGVGRGCYGNAPSAHARGAPRTRAFPTLPRTHRSACAVTSRRA